MNFPHVAPWLLSEGPLHRAGAIVGVVQSSGEERRMSPGDERSPAKTMSLRETPPPEVSEVEANMRWMRDREQLKMLYQRYAFGVDTRNFEIVRSVFQRVSPVPLSSATTYCTSRPSMWKISRSSWMIGDDPGPVAWSH